MKRLLDILVLAVVAVFMMVVSAMALPSLYISDDTLDINVSDLDGDGVVMFNGTIGIFDLSVTTGVTKPLIGAADFPMMDLNSIDVSSGNGDGDDGKLTIEWTESDFTLPDIIDGFIGEIGGTTSGTVTYDIYLDQTNALFGHGILLNSFGTFSAGAFSDSSIISIDPTEPFSLTLVATIEHSNSSSAITSFNAGIAPAPVPEPATVMLVGTGLLGMIAFGRKRFSKKA